MPRKTPATMTRYLAPNRRATSRARARALDPPPTGRIARTRVLRPYFRDCFARYALTAADRRRMAGRSCPPTFAGTLMARTPGHVTAVLDHDFLAILRSITHSLCTMDCAANERPGTSGDDHGIPRLQRRVGLTDAAALTFHSPRSRSAVGRRRGP